jgi:hypothetical protein
MQILASNHVDAVVLYWTALLPGTRESGAIEGGLSGEAGRGIFNASINGMTAPWRLMFVLELEKHEGVWIIASARYTTF